MYTNFEKFLMEKIEKTGSFFSRLIHAIFKALILFLLIVFILGVFNLLVGNL